MSTPIERLDTEHFPHDPDGFSGRCRPDCYGTALLCLLSFIVAAALITILVMVVVS